MDNKTWWQQHGETVWATVAALIIGVVLGYFYFKLGARPKKVDWFKLNATSILAIPDDQRITFGDLKISIGGVTKTHPNLILVKVINTGAWSVKQEDFDPPIRFTFETGELLRATVISQARESATIKITDVERNACGVQLSALNRREWFDVQFITDSEKPVYPKITGVVIGRREGALRDLAHERIKHQVRWAIIAVLCLCIFVVGVILSNKVTDVNSTQATVSTILGIGGICLAVVSGIIASSGTDWTRLRIKVSRRERATQLVRRALRRPS